MKLKLAVAAIGVAFAVPALAENASIGQSGNDNYANIEQTNSGAHASVYQYGNRNRVGFESEYGVYPGIRQTDVTSGFIQVQQDGDDNSAWASQSYGENLTVQIRQGGGRWEGDAYVDYGRANRNDASFYQYYGANNSVDAFQAGDGNSAYGWQTGSGNSMIVFQNGSNNRAMDLAQAGDGNVMNVSQTGSGNWAGYWYWQGVRQSGSGNQMDITQDGSNNYVMDASQYGSLNAMTISQTGVGHWASARQSGSGNTAVITQR